jgi:bifunctional non-homologous end joining protein LigD
MTAPSRDAASTSATSLPRDRADAVIRVAVDGEQRAVQVTNLRKPFWPELGLTKGDLIQWYIDVSPYLLPHLRARAMVMKRYPHGWSGEFFFMKRAPSPRPEWIRTCAIKHASGNVIDFPIVGDLATLIWTINLGCIDLNPWYARCDDVDRPDYLHFDLDPGNAPFARVREVAMIVHDALEALQMPSWVKTSGSKGLHVYVPIVRGPTQKQVWSIAKTLARELAARHPHIATAEYRIAKRPAGRVLIDYNQNAWGRTLASVYSVRPTALASVSMPITWRELSTVEVADFRVDNARARLEKKGDLWAPLAPESTERFELGRFL